jgi:hypothetical protein
MVRSVLFPDPRGPITATNSPSSTDRQMSCRALTVLEASP